MTTKIHPATRQPVPDETARVTVSDYPNSQPAKWPQADFIVGNPPFLGTARMRDALGDGYTEALRKTYTGKVPESADLVMYWWYKAAERVEQQTAKQFGFITTNSLKQTFNRRVIQPFLEGDKSALVLTFAIPDHPWVDGGDGAAVRIAMTMGERRSNGVTNGNLLTVKSESVPVGDDAADVTFIERQGIILPDLTIGANIDSTILLKSNAGISNRGVQLYGVGFIVDEEDANTMMASDTDKTKTTIRPYVNGRDLAANGRGVLVIDFFGFTEDEALRQNPLAFQRVLERVKPEREQSREPQVKKKWWLYGRTRDEMRESVKYLHRFIITLRVSKHNFSVFLNSDTLPDDRIVTVASDDAYHLGVLSSRIHTIWSLASGSRLGVGNDPIYNNSRCFDPFPFPDATPEQQTAIRGLAE